MPLQDSVRFEAQQHVAELCLPARHHLGEFGGEDGQDQFLHTGDTWRTILLTVQDPQVLPEQQEFKILLLIGLTDNGDKIE